MTGHDPELAARKAQLEADLAKAEHHLELARVYGPFIREVGRLAREQGSPIRFTAEDGEVSVHINPVANE